MSRETLNRSTLGRLQPGAPVNLERSVTPVTRLGGHLVQGHVDARGKFLGAEAHGGSWTVRIAYPPEIARYLVFKGRWRWKESVSQLPNSLTITSTSPSFPRRGKSQLFSPPARRRCKPRSRRDRQIRRANPQLFRRQNGAVVRPSERALALTEGDSLTIGLLPYCPVGSPTA